MKWLAASALSASVFLSCAGGTNDAEKQFNQIYFVGTVLICNKPNAVHTNGVGESVPGIGMSTGCLSNKIDSGFVFNFDTNTQLVNPITAGQNLICKCASTGNSGISSWFRVPAEVNPPNLYPTFIGEQPFSIGGIPGPFTQYQSGDILLCVPRNDYPLCSNGFHYQIVRVQ